MPVKSLAVAAHLKVLAEALAVDDPMTGMVLHGRPDQPGAKDMRGLFINMLPVSVSVPGGSGSTSPDGCSPRSVPPSRAGTRRW